VAQTEALVKSEHHNLKGVNAQKNLPHFVVALRDWQHFQIWYIIVVSYMYE